LCGARSSPQRGLRASYPPSCMRALEEGN
jgi:hypothetical protein